MENWIESKIPVSFTYKGVEYSGILSRAHGTGELHHYHLMIGNRYYGQLFLTKDYGWRFGSNDGMFEDIVDYFEAVVQAWYE